MKIVIFSGTTEGRKLSQTLTEAGAEVVVCVASEYGGEEQARVSAVETRIGPLSAEEKKMLLLDAELCVDATHPYAEHVTASVREACRETGVDYLRLLREPCAAENAVMFGSAVEAADYLAGQEGGILLTTGAKELTAFGTIPPERIFPRILPSHDSLAACEAVGIPHRNIIAMQGPFSHELNAAIIRQFGIRFLVTKDGGVPGGFPEKADAAAETGAQLIVLRRPTETGLSYEEVLNECIKRLRAANMNNRGERK